MYGTYRSRYSKSRYARKRYSGKRRGNLRTVKKVTGGTSASLLKLQKQVTAIRGKMRREASPPVYLAQTASVNAGWESLTLPTRHYRVIPLNNWTPVSGPNPNGKGLLFGTEESDIDHSKKMLWKSTNFRFKLTLENTDTEEETVHYDFYVVSLKDNAGDLLDRTTGGLQTLVEGTHYFSLTDQMHYLNKKMFNIHHHRHYMLTNNGESLLTPTSVVNHTEREWRYLLKFPRGNVIEANSSASNTVNWRELTYCQDPSKNFFIIILSDDGNVDLEQGLFRMTAMNKIQPISD